MKKEYVYPFGIFAVLIISILLIYFGFRVGRYEAFPFDLLSGVKQFFIERLDVEKSERFNNTALQRLHVNKVHLPEDKSSGGAMVSSGTDVIIIDREGEVSALDFLKMEKLNVDIPSIPMGFEHLNEMDWISRNNYRSNYFRVIGAYIDSVRDNYSTLYVFHHSFESGCFISKLSRISLQRNNSGITSVDDWREVYRTQPCIEPFLEDVNGPVLRWVFAGHVSGGGIVRYDDEHLLLSVGDYFFDGYDREIYAQDSEKSYGKFALVNIETGNSRIYATGTRNAQGLYKDEEGIIWSTEHGPQGGDELNIIKEGENYGWPEETLGINYSNLPWPVSKMQGRHDNYKKPFYSWARSIAPSEMLRIEGDKFGLWEGDLIVSTLNSKSIHRLRPDTDAMRIIYDERIEIGHRIRNIITLYDGSLLLRTDDNYLIHIDDAGPVYEDFDYDSFLKNNSIAKRFKEFNGTSTDLFAFRNADDTGRLVFERSCANCHAVGGRSLLAPDLQGLKNRKVGSLDDFDYSMRLEKSEEVWDKDLLKNYLQSPQDVFPGTSMSEQYLSNEELELIVDYLMAK